MQEVVFGFILGTLGSLFPVESAISCYQCASYNDPSCDSDTLPEFFLRLCEDPDKDAFDQLVGTKNETEALIEQIKPELQGEGNFDKEYKFCRKSVTRLYNKQESMWVTRVVRQCGYVFDPAYNNSCVRQRSLSLEYTLCTCQGDRCNDSGRVKLWGHWHWLLLLSPGFMRGIHE